MITYLVTQFYRIKGGGGAPPPIIFQRQILPQQTIYHWKGNLIVSRTHFKYQKVILISRLYEQFREMASEWLFKNIPHF